MTYDEFVTAPLRLIGKIQHKSDEVAIKMNIAMKTTTSFGDIASKPQGNRVEKSVMRYLEAKEELDSLLEELERRKAIVREFLYEALALESADILEWKYINGKSIQEIADIKNITYQSMKNKISKADREAREKYKLAQKSTKSY